MRVTYGPPMIARFLPVAAIAVLALVACAAPATPAASAPSVPPMSEAPSPSAVATATERPTVVATASPTTPPVADTAWSRLDVAGPSAREDHTWTADPAGSTAYLFGGRDGETVHGDLWAYDLEADTWTELTPAGGPAPRFGHEAVWADGVGLVIFAGQAGPTFFNDLWAFDPATQTWRALPSGGDVPVARYGSCAAIGPDGDLWISHGFTADLARFNDTRVYDFATGAWTDVTPASGLPVNRCLHGCWWTDDGALALFGGQTTGVTALDDRWTLRDGAWTRIEGSGPAARNLYARVRLPGATLVAGGQAADGSYLADAWLLPDGSADAEPLEVSGDGPAGRAGAELVRDASGRILLFGGRDADGAYADTWELTGLEISAP